MNVRLEVSHSRANVRRVVLRGDTVIGRAPECNLRIASSEVSRRHCKIILTADAVLVRDLGSSNGTFLDGALLDPGIDVAVAHGSLLSVGGVQFVVHYDAPVLAAADLEPEAAGSTIDFDPSQPAPAPEHAPAIGEAELGSDDETDDAWPVLPAEPPPPSARRVATEHDTVFNNPDQTVFEPAAGRADVLTATEAGPPIGDAPSSDERSPDDPADDDLHGFLRQFGE